MKSLFLKSPLSKNPKPPFYTATEVAKKLGKSPSYIAKLCRIGEINAYRTKTLWIFTEDMVKKLQLMNKICIKNK